VSGFESQFPSAHHSARAGAAGRAASDLANFRFRSRRKAQRIYLDAYRWVASDDRSYHFSFVNVCEA
jgi:hypothetical protein